jgi:amidohydrolase
MNLRHRKAVATNDGAHRAIDAPADRNGSTLIALSQQVHANPEVGFSATKASGWLSDAHAAGAIEVERAIGGLATAFRATRRGIAPGPTVAVIAAYNALSDLGHACSHNVIATCGIGAGLAIAQSKIDFAGQLEVIGTPAEEGGGGKITHARRGVLDDVEAAIMMYPSSKAMTRRCSLASGRVEVTFHGRAAHAAEIPEQGINALGSVLAMSNGVNARRLHFRSDVRVQGAITHDGDAVNIIPSRATCACSVRDKDRTYQRILVSVLREVAGSAARMTGTTLDWREARGYDNMCPVPPLAPLARHTPWPMGWKTSRMNRTSGWDRQPQGTSHN